MNLILREVSNFLQAEGIPFTVIGATAMAVHGVSRATQDVDLLVTSRTCLQDAFWTALRARGLEVEVREGDDEDPLAGVVHVIALDTGIVIDIVVGKPAWQEPIAVRAKVSEIDSVALPVAVAADLVLLKLYAGGMQDRWDVVQLVAMNPDVVAAVDSGAAALPVAAQKLWEMLRPGRE